MARKFNGPVRWGFGGDPAQAQKYTGISRLFLQMAKDRMGDDQAFWTRILPDGTKIIVSSLGGVNQIWITPQTSTVENLPSYEHGFWFVDDNTGITYLFELTELNRASLLDSQWTMYNSSDSYGGKYPDPFSIKSGRWAGDDDTATFNGIQLSWKGQEIPGDSIGIAVIEKAMGVNRPSEDPQDFAQFWVGWGEGRDAFKVSRINDTKDGWIEVASRATTSTAEENLAQYGIGTSSSDGSRGVGVHSYQSGRRLSYVDFVRSSPDNFSINVDEYDYSDKYVGGDYTYSVNPTIENAYSRMCYGKWRVICYVYTEQVSDYFVPITYDAPYDYSIYPDACQTRIISEIPTEEGECGTCDGCRGSIIYKSFTEDTHTEDKNTNLVNDRVVDIFYVDDTRVEVTQRHTFSGYRNGLWKHYYDNDYYDLGTREWNTSHHTGSSSFKEELIFGNKTFLTAQRDDTIDAYAEDGTVVYDNSVASGLLGGVQYNPVGQWYHYGYVTTSGTIYEEIGSLATGEIYFSETRSTAATDFWDPGSTLTYSESLITGIIRINGDRLRPSSLGVDLFTKSVVACFGVGRTSMAIIKNLSDGSVYSSHITGGNIAELLGFDPALADIGEIRPF